LAKLKEKFKKSWHNLGIYKLLLATEYNIRPNIPLWGAAFLSWSKSSNVFVCMIATNLLDPGVIFRANPHGLEVETDDWYWKGGLKIWNPVKHIMPIWELRWRIPWISKWEHETSCLLQLGFESFYTVTFLKVFGWKFWIGRVFNVVYWAY
jgi:hypothetical protein